MADTKISALPLATSIDGTEVVPIVQSGTNKIATLATVKANVISDATLLKTSAIGVTVQPYDATTLKSSAIGTTVQPYSANTVLDASYVHTDNNYSTAEQTKLAGIADGAEANVNADWLAVGGDAEILNKPTLAAVATTGAYADLSGKPTLGTAAAAAATDFATAAQGSKADTALQPAAIGVTVQAYDAYLTSWGAIAPSAKQDTLVSGTNIKTINGSSLLGAGDLTVSAFDVVQFNNIGVPGTAGFGVGICPSLPDGFTPLPGSTDPLSANYGNYQFSDGSVMVWIPAFYLRLGHAGNPTYAAYGVNSISIKPLSAYPTEAEANNDGFYLHRAFFNAGANQLGFFRDKYDCSLNGNVASSIANAMPMVSGPVSMAATAMVAGTQYTVLTVGTTDYTLVGGTNVVGARFTATGPGTGTGTVSQQVGFLGATANGQAPANAYYGAINAARSRGAKFVPETIFMADALSRLTEAHAQASTSATYCAWYDATGVKNFPKGNNNGALKDIDDTSVTFTSAGVAAYPAFALTGSGAPFAKTTHNGQACGVSDVAGNIWKINPGMTCIAAAKAITAATQTNPVQLRIVGHGYTTGRLAMITGVVGMTQINDKFFKLTVIDADNVSLDGVDGTAFTAYTSGGSCTTGTFQLLKPSVDVAALTSGATLATDHWGATGVAANFDPVELNFATNYPSNGFAQRFGNGANAVFDWASPAGRALAMAGMPAAGGVSVAGSNLMGLDYFYQYLRDQLCVLSRGYWGSGSDAGSRYRNLNYNRPYATAYVGFAASRYQ